MANGTNSAGSSKASVLPVRRTPRSGPPSSGIDGPLELGVIAQGSEPGGRPDGRSKLGHSGDHRGNPVDGLDRVAHERQYLGLA